MFFADIILPFALPQLYTYQIPDNLISNCQKGKRAVVQFGKKKIYTGIIRNIHNNKPKDYDTKEIITILDNVPIINEVQFRFWDWIASYYMCTVGEVFKAALPAGLKLESETKLSYNKDSFDENEMKFSEKELAVIDEVQKKETLSIIEINAILEQKSSMPIIKLLMEK